MNEMTLPISEQMFWGIVFVGGFVALSFLVFSVLPRLKVESVNPLEKSMQDLGLTQLNPALFFVLATLWAGIFLLLTGGLFGLIWDVIWHALPTSGEANDSGTSTAVWSWRFRLVQMTALTTVLGAVVILPVTLLRLRLNKEQTETAKASLFNDKITEAAADLHAQRQVSKKIDDEWITLWEDDVVRRNAAIDRLEVLVEEQPNEAMRVSRLLSVYVREISNEARIVNSDATNDERFEAILAIDNVERSDLENAVQVLGRLLKNPVVEPSSVQIDLKGAHLQAMDLRELNFENANFSAAKMHRTKLDGTNLKLANLSDAQLQFAELRGASLETSNLEYADLRCTLMANSNFRGANCESTRFDELTVFTDATFDSASIRKVDLEMVPQFNGLLNHTFADATTILSDEELRPTHWLTAVYNDREYDAEYRTKWRTFAASKGVDIPD